MSKHVKRKSGEPIWSQTTQIRKRPALKSNTKADVCIVGAGIAGVTTAYLLAKTGKKVIVLDDGRIGGGQTTATTAHLTCVLDRRYFELEELRGLDNARLAAASHIAAINLIEKIIEEEQIECEFRRLDGYLFAPPGESRDVLEREYDAVIRTGMIEVHHEQQAPWPNFDTGPCLRFAKQAAFHPLKYLAGLSAAFWADGGRICCGTHVVKAEGGELATIETELGPTVTARDVVIATNSPVNDMFAIHTKQAPYISYAIGARILADTVPDALYWDTADPYHYVRIEPDQDSVLHVHLIVGGEDHRSGQAQDGAERFARLEDWARERFPSIEEIDFQWAGQVMQTMDGLAFIGRNPLDYDNVFIATGDSGVGMTHGTIAGMILKDLIVGQDNPWSAIYDPSRVPARALSSFVRENLNVASQYADWLTPGEVASVDEIAPGHGAIRREGLSKVAVYRDPGGKICELSASCPHLKCVVAWNDTEQTWDCPCHGSRFDPQGKVLNGPANTNLEPWPRNGDHHDR